MAGALTGVAIGFLIPPLAAYTFRIQNGMNLYNAGFACGLLGMLLVPVLKAFGLEPASAHFWGHRVQRTHWRGVVRRLCFADPVWMVEGRERWAERLPPFSVHLGTRSQ